MKSWKRSAAFLTAVSMLMSFATACNDDVSVQVKDPNADPNAVAEAPADGEPESSVDIDHVNNYTESGKVYSQTIMVYMVGSDLESQHGNATLDLSEMEEAMPLDGDSRVVVCAGGASQWQNSVISPEDMTILELGNNGFQVVDTQPKENMGEADTLASFINYCTSNYTTDQYNLILWDHGGGPVFGFGVDENYDDILNLPEMTAALENSIGQTGQKLEWIGFDACLMSSLEVADAFQPYANYLIASQETEPGWGWNYAFLSQINEPDMDGAHFSKAIIDSYMDFGEALFAQDARYYSDLTLSCLDLKLYGNAALALNDFFTETNQALSPETFPNAVRNRSHAKRFGGYSSSFDYCLVDASHLISLLADKKSSMTYYPARDALSDMTVYTRSNVSNANGISLCYPTAASSDYAEYCLEMQEASGFLPAYVSYLKDYYAIQTGDTLVDEWDVADAESEVHALAIPVEEAATEAVTEAITELATEAPTEAETEPEIEPETEPEEEITDTQEILSEGSTTGSDICLKLTKEQQENFGGASYYILCKADAANFTENIDDERADDMYIFIHGGKNAVLDQSGTLHAYYNNNVVYMKDNTTGELSDIPMILIDNDSSSVEKRYFTSVVLTKVAEDIADWDIAGANLQIVVNSEYPNGIIRSAVPIDSDDSQNKNIRSASKQLMDLKDFTYMSVAGRCSYVTRGQNGQLLPFFDWEQSGWQMGFEQDLTHDYALSVQPIQHPENFVCMFVVQDAQGHSAVSELIPLA